MFSVTTTSNDRAERDEAHRTRVDELVLERDVGELGGDLDRDLAPEPRRLEHVRLVHRGDALLAPACELEREAHDARDLVLAVLERVDRATLTGDHLAETRLAEVEAAGQLAHEEDVDALEELGLQRRGRRERGVHAHRTQVREEAEALAEPEQALLGPDVFAFGSSHFGPPTAPSSTASQRFAHASSVASAAADRRPASMAMPPMQVLVERELVIEARGDGLEDLTRASRTTSAPIPSPGKRTIVAFIAVSLRTECSSS